MSINSCRFLLTYRKYPLTLQQPFKNIIIRYDYLFNPFLPMLPSLLYFTNFAIALTAAFNLLQVIAANRMYVHVASTNGVAGFSLLTRVNPLKY